MVLHQSQRPVLFHIHPSRLFPPSPLYHLCSPFTTSKACCLSPHLSLCIPRLCRLRICQLTLLSRHPFQPCQMVIGRGRCCRTHHLSAMPPKFPACCRTGRTMFPRYPHHQTPRGISCPRRLSDQEPSRQQNKARVLSNPHPPETSRITRRHPHPRATIPNRPTPRLSLRVTCVARESSSGSDLIEGLEVLMIRCDGARPKCHHCTRRNEPLCEYDTVLRRRGPGKKTKKSAQEGDRDSGSGDGSGHGGKKRQRVSTSAERGIGELSRAGRAAQSSNGISSNGFDGHSAHGPVRSQ